MSRVLLSAAILLLLALVPSPATFADELEEGYTEIFNGRNLAGWEGDERFWKVENGYIEGKTTPENKAPHNTFLIWRDGKLKNFHLKLKYRILTGNNSGVQYRSKDLGGFSISGYQAEVENKLGKTGFLYHEKGRGWLVDVGDSMVIDEQGKKRVVNKVAALDWLKAQPYHHDNEWNEYHIICRGNHILHYLNNYPTVELIDRDEKGRLMEGVLALQIHAGSPMTVQYKDIRIKQLDGNYGEAVRLFDGESLEGWTFSGDDQKEVWSAQGNALHCAGSPRGYIRTENDFTNYALHLQIRHEKAGNSGVLVRMVGKDKVWPRSIELQGGKGNLGDIWNIDAFPMTVDTSRTKGRRTIKLHESNERPVGQWNDYDIVLDGEELTASVNNLVQNHATDVWETPGKICFQSEGAEVEFRNIALIPILDDKQEASE